MSMLRNLLNKTKEGLKMCDLFKTTQFFRYKSEPQYRTLTGGGCSIMIVVLFVAFFATSIITTFNKGKLNWNYNLVQEASQQFSITSATDTPAKFMFAIGVSDFDMNQGERYFDLFLTQNYQSGSNVNTVAIPLVPCSRQSWEGANDTILQIYDRLNFNKLLCPPDDYTFDISGMESAPDFKYVRISAQTCNDSLSPRPCASNATINQYLLDNPNFYLKYYFINTLLNPAKPSEISFYLEDRNFVPFNIQYGGMCRIFISEYNVLTDQSIMPYTSVRNSRGGLVNFVGQVIASRTFRNEMASIHLRKSSTSMNIVRQYDKLDNTLSYIGGLFGFLMIAFLFMQIYTEYSYEIEMGDRLYHYDKNDALNSQHFNFITFIGYLLYSFLQKIGLPPDWSIMQKYDDCRNEIQKQFDICFLMKRLIFLERSIRILFEDHQFKMLHMYEKLTLKDAQELREFYKMRDRLNAEDIQVTENNETNQKKDYNEHAEMNVTDNILANSDIFKEEIIQISFQTPSNKDSPPKLTRNYGQPAASDTIIKKESKNESQIKEGQERSAVRISEPEFNSKLKLLHRESQNGNMISKKIYEGFDSLVLKNLLLKVQKESDKKQAAVKIEEKRQQGKKQVGSKVEVIQNSYEMDCQMVEVKQTQKAEMLNTTKNREGENQMQKNGRYYVVNQSESKQDQHRNKLNQLFFQDIS